MTKEEFANIQQTLPQQPGVYKYYNAEGKIIYVGKAKNLRKRVTSYFSKISDYYKTRKLVSEIHHIEFTIVISEQDAFLLENSQIKQYQPKYNIMLKDDRSYPNVVIKNEPFPRIFLTRRKINDGSEYIGPFTDVWQIRNLLQLIRQTIPLRNCSLNLSAKSIERGKYRPCLEYHIGNCKAPCAKLQTLEEYEVQVQQVRDLLKGKLGGVIKYYKQEMLQFAEDLQFEKAEIIRKRIEYLQNFQSKSVVVSKSISNVDVCTVVSNAEMAFANYMVVSQGTIIHTHSVPIPKTLQESDEEILLVTLSHLREKYKSTSKEVILPMPIDWEEEITQTIPRGGDKKKLLELSLHNANYFMQEYKRHQALHLDEQNLTDKNQLLARLQQELRLPQIPMHIECFDNSNFQGSYPVAAMVCFKQGVPYKKEYRHFHIKTVEGINDFASMKEIVRRRYERVLEEGADIPQLIIIDGGKGQLSSAMEVIKDLGLVGKTTVVGLAKNVEELFFPGDQQSILLDYQSPTLNLLKYIRDEVHRFGITFHRKTRSKGIVKNELEEIAGIGPALAKQLLIEFRSIKKIKEAPLQRIEEAIGKSKAKLVYDHFHPAE
jgi:excinuclease ABC subunit C